MYIVIDVLEDFVFVGEKKEEEKKTVWLCVLLICEVERERERVAVMLYVYMYMYKGCYFFSGLNKELVGWMDGFGC